MNGMRDVSEHTFNDSVKQVFCCDFELFGLFALTCTILSGSGIGADTGILIFPISIRVYYYQIHT
jgi:hypothetical protein